MELSVAIRVSFSYVLKVYVIPHSLPKARLIGLPRIVMHPSRSALIDLATGEFRRTFGKGPDVYASAPGRVNLIGEHTDYNGGFVLPMALDRSICVVASSRTDGILDIRSRDLDASVRSHIDDVIPDPRAPWSNYILGVAVFLRRQGAPLSGANIVVTGDIPRGAGLSSSAALEVATAFLFREMNGLQITDMDVAKLCQRVENDFVGVRCGIMDQYVSARAREGHALLIDCMSLKGQHIPFPDNVTALVCDTGVRRELAASEYNLRRAECEEGVHILSRFLPGIQMLRDVALADFERYREQLPEPIRSRCHHVITENDRVVNAVAALKAGDLSTFGKLLYESHMSLKNDYEVSCPELDAIVDICAEADGVYGGRMTGAGFGGSAVCIVETGYLARLEARIRKEYPVSTGREPTILVSRAEGGALAMRLRG